MEVMEIPLTQGHAALVDADDYERISSYNWCFNGSGYAVRRGVVGGKVKLIRMHRVIMNAPVGINVDHINGNRLDNRRSNLRLANQTQNMRNRGPQKNNKTGLKGVSYNRSKGGFVAQITVDGKNMSLGVYSNPEDAGRVYDLAVLEYFGEFGRLNSYVELNTVDPSAISKAETNQRLNVNNTSGYRGIWFQKLMGKFQASIWMSGKRKHLGSFLTAEEAARAYDQAALEVYGGAAKLNFAPETVQKTTSFSA